MELESKRCPNCGDTNIDENLRCNTCETQLQYSNDGSLIIAGISNACPKCDTVNPSDNRFCSRCGEALHRLCSYCGAEHLVGTVYCPSTGINIDRYSRLVNEVHRLEAVYENIRNVILSIHQKAKSDGQNYNYDPRLDKLKSEIREIESRIEMAKKEKKDEEEKFKKDTQVTSVISCIGCCCSTICSLIITVPLSLLCPMVIDMIIRKLYPSINIAQSDIFFRFSMIASFIIMNITLLYFLIIKRKIDIKKIQMKIEEDSRKLRNSIKEKEDLEECFDQEKKNIFKQEIDNYVSDVKGIKDNYEMVLNKCTELKGNEYDYPLFLAVLIDSYIDKVLEDNIYEQYRYFLSEREIRNSIFMAKWAIEEIIEKNIERKGPKKVKMDSYICSEWEKGSEISIESELFAEIQIEEKYEEYANDDKYLEEYDESNVTCGVCGKRVSPSIVVYVDRRNALHRAENDVYDWPEPPWVHPELENMRRKGYRLKIKDSFPTSAGLPSLICCDYCQKNGNLNNLIKRYVEFV